MSGQQRPASPGNAVNVTVVDHPLVVDALARIRDRTTPNALFRQNLERIGTLLMARATETLPTLDTTVTTPLTDAPARRASVVAHNARGWRTCWRLSGFWRNELGAPCI